MHESSAPVGRLAPSPTGAQHLGNARTYILAWLSVRSRGGRVVLRIEDIDSPRVKPWATQQAIDDLRWLGLDWDEGPDIGGPNAPYIQTERREHYAAALEQLRAANLLYPCTCTRKDIEEAASAPHEAIDGAVYPGICASWRQGDPLPPGGSYCWRFRASESSVEFDDQAMGLQKLIPSQRLGDFPVARKTGEAAYQLAVVVDDIAMGVNEVLRGNDLIPSTFRQIELYQAMGVRPPEYVHVPLVCGNDARRLAKRHGDTRLSYFRERGTEPESIVGWALWSTGLLESNHAVNIRDFLQDFSLSKLNPADSVLSEQTCNRLLSDPNDPMK